MLRCFVVGMGNFPALCCEILRAAGFDLLGAHAPDGSLEDASRTLGVPYSASGEEFAERLRSEPFEYLFSLNNLQVIPEDLARRALADAINYHDSLLPRYAGFHATSWALVQGETAHGVTFHRVTRAIDTGAILKRRVVPIFAQDTAWTLNARCFETALECFRELCGELAQGRAAATPTPHGPASYFGRRDRPARAATLDLTRPAAELRNLVRALDFGGVENPLATPKLLVGSDLVGIRRVELRGPASGPPGTLHGWARDTLEVSTGTHDVTLGGLCVLSGEPLSSELLAERQGLASGVLLPTMAEAVAIELDAYVRRVCTMEPRWARTLAEFHPSEPPYQLSVPDRPGASARLPALERVLREAPEALRPRLALASIVAVLTRLGDAPDVGIGLWNDLVDSPLSAWFETIVPFVVEGDPARTMGALLDLVEERRKLVLAGSHSRDLFARYPALRSCGQPRFRLAVRCAEPTHDAVAAAVDLELVAPSQGEVRLVHHGALEPWQVESFDEALAEAAQTALRHPETAVAAVALLSPQARHRVLVEWNATEREIPDRCVHELIAEAAHRHPQLIAVRFGAQSLTYCELLRRSGVVAERLLRAGVHTGDVVALSAPRSLELIVGMLGILQAGAAYMPIDPGYPEARGRTMVTDAAVRIGVTTTALAAKYFSGCEVVLLTDDTVPPARPACIPSPRPPVPDDLVYVIYTSGSTGKPKGVEVRHRGLVNHSLAIARNYALGHGDRVLCSASISFDVSAEQIYPALLSGAEVVVRPDDLFDSFARFDAFLRAERISVMVLPTSFWHEWVGDMEAHGKVPPESVRALCVGSEKALGEHLLSWQRQSRGMVRFFEGYGPTEATVTCTMCAHDGSEPDPSRPLPIGRPIANTQIYLLDAFGQPVPIGAVGEIHVGGFGLARGYRNNAEMTRERFRPNPFRPGERFYRTGDLARFQPDGQILFLGRRDSQVKVRGFRVELGEIEQVLREHPGVDQAVVLVRSDTGAPELVAYVVPRGGAIHAETVLEFVRARVPDYMAPRTLVAVRAFPKTNSQKVDRAALPPPPRTEAGVAARVPPTDEREQALHSLWVEVLAGQDQFGVDDDFFSLGGNSLSAVRMLSAAEQRFRARIPLSQFATGATIAKLARSIAERPVQASLVVRVQEGDSRTPLWVVHPVGGHVVYAQLLRRHMDPAQPIRGIQARGLDGRAEPLDTVEAMAALYVERVLEEQPRGPYLLAGPSMGGLVAYEMAQILRRRGHRVALLALLDTWGPNFPTRTSRWTLLADRLETIRSQKSWGSRVQFVRDRLPGLRLALPFGASDAKRSAPPRYNVLEGVELPPDLREAILEVTRANQRAHDTYRPAPYDGPVLLMRAAFPMRWSGMRFDDPDNGWRPLVRGSFDRVVIDCTHYKLCDDPPLAAGRALQDAVDRALSQSPLSHPGEIAEV